MIAGWAMDDNYKTPLITAAIKMAARNLDLNTRDFRCLGCSGCS
jgi:hypothetical protein